MLNGATPSIGSHSPSLRNPGRAIARCVSLGLVIAFAGTALGGCALFPDQAVSDHASDRDSGDDENTAGDDSNDDSGEAEGPAWQAMPATEGCPAGFVENLAPVAEFVPTSVETELGDDPIAQLPFFEHVCMGNGIFGAMPTAYFGGSHETLKALGEDLAEFGFYQDDELEGKQGYVRMSWRRDSPATLITAITWEDNPSLKSFGLDATGLMTPSFSVTTVAYLD